MNTKLLQLSMLESIDFSVINYKLRKCQKNRRERISSKTGYQSREYQECYKNYKAKNYYIGSLATYPIYEIKYKIPIGFNNKICNYTEEGQAYVHKQLGYHNPTILYYLMNQPVLNRSIEYNDILYLKIHRTKGAYGISGQSLGIFSELHYIKP